MFHEAIIKFRINGQESKKDAQRLAEQVIKEIQDYENSAIVFIEKPELITIEEKGINCNNCKYCYREEIIIGDRGNGVETRIKSVCEHNNEEIIPIMVDFCEYYEE